VIFSHSFKLIRTRHHRSHSEPFPKSGTAQAVRCRSSQILHRRSCAQTAFKSTFPNTVVRAANASLKAERRKPSGVASSKSFTGDLAPNRFQVHLSGRNRSHSEPFDKSGTAQAVRCRNSQIPHRRACVQTAFKSTRPNTIVRTANPSLKAERRKPSGVATRKSLTGDLTPNRFQVHLSEHPRSHSEPFPKSGTAQAVRCRNSQILHRRSCAQYRFQVHLSEHPRSHSERFHKSGTAQAVRCRNSQILHRRACGQPLSSPPDRSAKVQGALTKIRVSKAILSHHHPVPQACIG